MSERDVFDCEQLLAIFAGTHGAFRLNAGLLRDVFQLTDREAEICAAMVTGRSPAQIADRSGRAEKTIRNQIQSVYDKIGVNSNRELAEALSVFRTVGAMFDSDDPYLFRPRSLPRQ
nr:helix-turn-helix transcriptional regulator [Thalassococcus arenae]